MHAQRCCVGSSACLAHVGDSNRACGPESGTSAPTLRVPRAKTRLHVNPLSPELLARPPEKPQWDTLLSDSSLPLHLDLGCAYGELCLMLADSDVARNYVGVDLRDRVLDRARALSAARRGRQRNVAFLQMNIRHPEFLSTLLSDYKGALAVTSVLFPDPWKRSFERRRRLLQPGLVAAVASVMIPGGLFVTATDNEELAMEMRSCFDPQRWRNASDGVGFSRSSPFAVSTAWERTIQGRNSPIYWTQHHRLED